MSNDVVLSIYKSNKWRDVLSVDVLRTMHYKRHTKATKRPIVRGIPADHDKIAESGSRDAALRTAFSRNLYQAIVAKGWTQSELAKRADVTRDVISRYVGGKMLPKGTTLANLAKALDMRPEELMPSVAGNLSAQPIPAGPFSYTEIAPGKVRLQVNKVVKTATAMKIGQIIHDDDTEASD